MYLEGIEAELAAFRASLPAWARSPRSVAAHRFLDFLARRGKTVCEVEGEDVAAFRSEVKQSGDPALRIARILEGTNLYLRFKVARGEVPEEALYSSPFEAELRPFTASMSRRKRCHYKAGAREFLAFLASRGKTVREVEAGDVVGFRSQVMQSSAPPARIKHTLEGTSAYLRYKVARQEAAVETLFPLHTSMALLEASSSDSRVLAAIEESRAFAASLAPYSRSHVIGWQRAALLLVLHLLKRGKTVPEITALDWATFREQAVVLGRGSVCAKDRVIELVSGARAYLAWKAELGLLRRDQVFPPSRQAREDLALPTGLCWLPQELDKAMRVAILAPGTRLRYRTGLEDFLRHLVEVEGVLDLASVTREVMTSYRLHLQSRTSRRGLPYAVATQIGNASALRFLFSWLVKTGQVLSDPLMHLPNPRAPDRLPRVPRVREVRRLIERIPKTTVGLRDRALVELLYGTGMRRGEAVGLALSDVDLEQGTVLIREGKGGKERLVPLPARAKEALLDYLDLSRGRLLKRETNMLFLSIQGRPLGKSGVTDHVKVLGERVGLHLWPHLLRHSCATHLLQGRADIRHIQRLLGHRSLSTTERYTRVEVQDLREVIRRCHPRGRLK